MKSPPPLLRTQILCCPYCVHKVLAALTVCRSSFVPCGDSLDWKDLSADEIVKRVTENTKAGDIILFHNNADEVETYLPKVLQILQEKGFEIVPVGQLIYRDHCRTDAAGRQFAEEEGMEE